MKLFLVFALFSLLLHAEAKRSFYDDAEDSGSIEDIQAYKASPRLASAVASSGAKAVPNIPTRASPAKVIPLADSDEEQTSESEEGETSASASAEEEDSDDDENELDEDEDGEDSEEDESEEVTPSTTTSTTTTTTTPTPIEATPAAKRSSRRHRKKTKKTDEAKQAEEVPSVVDGKIPEVREQFVQLAQDDDISQAREGFIQRYGRPPVKLISQTSKVPRKPKVTLSPVPVIPPSKSTSEEEEEEEEKTPVKTSGKRRHHRNRHQKQQKETSKLPSALADRVRDESNEEVVVLKPIKIDFPRDDLPRVPAQKVEEVEEAPRQKKKRTRHHN